MTIDHISMTTEIIIYEPFLQQIVRLPLRGGYGVFLITPLQTQSTGSTQAQDSLYCQSALFAPWRPAVNGKKKTEIVTSVTVIPQCNIHVGKWCALTRVNTIIQV
ncbi:hypothetical protein DPMN_104389 [Dreissena polymorpha]|uniref:Uncharacterized protein n=1 Tax=Dreissena polymorpha TaxID=45954 RepID=A0A9D4K2Q8_DREPO|nr:hypothetical protein DPMN_104389 [Dreissena polymorpha]